ncbi:MutS protein msh4 [Rhodotorula toruloides]|uniref:DNA mismatch repair protein MSH3 n=1 Tax=Rhodotorula toruloides (strain NP11) TaxID=1130832 RepID=M7WRY7_RHOT1|nr:DNA mismatch repair protein MSH4 [Rhodotorula toruloides NP11]EMS20821.1 DNA mismatch repair protein MSH4 [Rhodotorula toruloides NP11]
MASRSRAGSRPATARTVATSYEGAASWVLAILPGRGTGRDVGVVALDKEDGQVVVTQFTDSTTWVKTLHLCRNKPPDVILLPQSALATPRYALAAESEANEAAGSASPEAAMLVKGLQTEFKDVPLIGVARKYWNEQASFEFLTQLIVHDEDRLGVLTACKPKYYALSAICALFKYLETSYSLSFAPKTLKIGYSALEGTCLIDADSVKNLELVSNMLNKNSKQHLLGMLDKCCTAMGTRHLRSNILSPLTEPSVIDARLDTVEELVKSEERLRAIRKALEQLKSVDLDKIVSRLLAAEKRPSTGTRSTSRGSIFPSFQSSTDPSSQIASKLDYLLSLRNFLSTLPTLRSSVENSDSIILMQVEKVLQDDRLEQIRAVIEENVNPDIWKKGDEKRSSGRDANGGRHARLFAIKAEKKRLLDVARETWRENTSDVNDLCDTLRDKYGLEGLALVQGGKGSAYVFQLTKEEWEEKKGEIGKAFTNVNVLKKRVEFSSLDLQKRNARLQESEQEIYLMSEEILEEMFQEIRGCVACLYKCSEAIALLDMLAAFADLSAKEDYVRPEWTDTLAIKAGRHPLHEQFRLSDGSFVPNDTYASDAASFQLINGPNMSGKSTLLRQIALLHVMAQIGCFVPAAYASFRPISALLTRLSNDDNLESSLSTFASEMATMSMILAALQAHEGRRCLVIVDELGRGTSPEEGVGIAFAIAEEIIRSKAFCFFATHFKELSIALPSRYPNVVALHLETDVDEKQPDFSLTFLHKVRDGATPHTHYGLELAKAVKLPSPVLYKARLVSLTLESLAEDGRKRSSEGKLVRRRRGLLELKTRLREIATGKTDDAGVLLAQLRQLQKETIEMLDETMDAAQDVDVDVEAEASKTEDAEEIEEVIPSAAGWRVTEIKPEDLSLAGTAEEGTVDEEDEEDMLPFD